VLLPLMFTVKPAPRPLKAVSASGTRATAPPIWKKAAVLTGETIRRPPSTRTSIASSVSSGRSQARK
jgi:hypothetical protein